MLLTSFIAVFNRRFAQSCASALRRLAQRTQGRVRLCTPHVAVSVTSARPVCVCAGPFAIRAHCLGWLAFLGFLPWAVLLGGRRAEQSPHALLLLA